MTGFGRTGRWFGLDHWGVRPDLLVAAKGATSGYWPFGFVAASGSVHATVTEPGAGFVHGFTFSHSPVGAAVAREVLRILREERLVEASAEKGERLIGLLRDRLADHPAVGDIRGRGLLVGLELVADRETRRPFRRAARVTEAVVLAARRRGVLVYSGTGNADGVDGDTILLGPPFIVTDDELVRIADVLAEAVTEAVDGSIVDGSTVAAAAVPDRRRRRPLSEAGRHPGTRRRTPARPPARRARSGRPAHRPAARACSPHPTAPATRRTRPAIRSRRRTPRGPQR